MQQPSVSTRSFTPLRHSASSAPSTPARSSAVAMYGAGRESIQRPVSRLHGSPLSASLRPTAAASSAGNLAASFSYVPSNNESTAIHHAPPLNGNSSKPPLSSTPTSVSNIAFPAGMPAFSSSQTYGTPVKQSMTPSNPSWFATSTAGSSTPPPQRRPLGDASFLTQAARLSSGAAYQYTPVKMPPTPSRGPALQFGCGSTASTPSRASTPTAPSLLRPHPHQHHRPLLVLDLDETLVHASVETTDGEHDVSFVVEMNQQKINVYVKIRPFAKEFLRRVGQLFEVCVFTASLAPYADRVVDYLDPSGHLVHHRLYREHCTNVEGSYVKDMSLMGRSIERVAIVDNSPVAYSFHPENAIPILSWFEDRSDKELMSLMPLLEHFAQGKDFFHTRRKFQITVPSS